MIKVEITKIRKTIQNLEMSNDEYFRIVGAYDAGIIVNVDGVNYRVNSVEVNRYSIAETGPEVPTKIELEEV